VTAIVLSVAPLTVSGALPVTLPRVARMFAVPAETAVALPPPGVIVATEVLSEAHTTSDVIICVLESLKAPVALNGCFVPGAIVLLEGVTVIETTVALVTVRVVFVVVAPSVAVIIVVPAAMPFATPFPKPMVAMEGADEVQVTKLVRLRVPPSLNVPVAVNLRLVFRAIEGLAGVIASEDRLAEFTVSEVLPLMDPDVALIVTVPRFTPVARPLTVIEAMLLPDEAQVTVLVMS
jgi:hypothetical protein